MKNPLGGNGNDSQRMGTPRWFVAALQARRGVKIGLDVCAEPETAVCDRYFTATDDGLIQSWHAHVEPDKFIWCKPPFGNVSPWIEKAFVEASRVNLVLMLLPFSPGTQWFRNFAWRASAIEIVVPRMNFWCPIQQRILSGVAFNSCLWYIDVPKPESFEDSFRLHYFEARKPKDAVR